MTTYSASIVDSGGSSPSFGDHVTVTRSVTDIPAGDSLASAKLTVKRQPSDADVDAVLQLSITGSPSGDGQITDTGDGDETGAVTFTISGADYDDLAPDVIYHYDIELTTTEGVVSTLERGRLNFVRDITRGA